LPASPEATPSSDIIVVELKELARLKERLRAALGDLAGNAIPMNELIGEISMCFGRQKLLWPDVLDGVISHRLQDITQPI
jgi:hypothetical protein